jgi:hypothetical protein
MTCDSNINVYGNITLPQSLHSIISIYIFYVETLFIIVDGEPYLFKWEQLEDIKVVITSRKWYPITIAQP